MMIVANASYLPDRWSSSLQSQCRGGWQVTANVQGRMWKVDGENASEPLKSVVDRLVWELKIKGLKGTLRVMEGTRGGLEGAVSF